MSDAAPQPVLFLLYDFAPTIGGVQTWFRGAAEHMQPPVTVVCAAGPDIEADALHDAGAAYEVVRLPLRERTLMDRALYKTAIKGGAPYWGFHRVMRRKALDTVVRLVREREVPTIHCGYHFLADVAAAAARRTGARWYLYVHGNELLKARESSHERSLLRRADRVFVLSEFNRERLAELGVAPERVTKVCVGVPLPPETSADGLREKWGLPVGAPVLLTVSRLAARKGVETLIDAVAALRERFPGLVYVVAGDGDSRPALEARARDAGLGDAVRFTGFVSPEQRDELLRVCDVFSLVPRMRDSHHDVEGFGIVYVEAGAYGKPVLAGRSGGVPDAVLDGETGLLVDPEDTEAVRRGLERLLIDADLRTRLGSAARERVAREFRWELFEAAVTGG